MARIITFVGMCIVILLVLGLGSYKDLPVNNGIFSFEDAKQIHQDKLNYLAELEKEKTKSKKPMAEAVVKTEPLVVLDTQELKRGSELYQKCLICHGKSGEGKASQKAPKIGGQHDWYVELQVKNIRDEVRINKVMMPYVRKLSDQDIADLSVYISKLPW